MRNLMSVFDGIEHIAPESIANKQYFEEGNYIVQIESLFLYEKRLGGGKLFIAETLVKESDNPNIKPGEKRNWVQSLNMPSALPRIKTFLGVCMGFCSKSQIKEINSKINTQVCDKAVGPQNPFRGKVLRLECINRTSKMGKVFTQTQWSNP
jgi:hypothetical protein